MQTSDNIHRYEIDELEEEITFLESKFVHLQESVIPDILEHFKVYRALCGIPHAETDAFIAEISTRLYGIKSKNVV